MKKIVTLLMAVSLLLISTTAFAFPYVMVIRTPNSTTYYFAPAQTEASVSGIVRVSQIEGKHYELGTSNGIYVLVGNNLERFVGKRVVVKGTVSNNPNIWMRGRVLNVKSIYEVSQEYPIYPAK